MPSCKSEEQSSAPDPQPSPTQTPESSSEIISTTMARSENDESDSCNVDPSCSYENAETTEVEAKQAYEQLMAVVASVAPPDGTEALTGLVEEDHEAWMTSRDNSCNLDRALAQHDGLQGATPNLIHADCITDFNRDRINKLVGILQKFSNSNPPQGTSSNGFQDIALTPGEEYSFMPRRVQDLTKDGDYLLSSEEPPFDGGEYILVLRKRGNIVIVSEGHLNSDGGCSRKVLKSDNEVETTVFEGESERFITKSESGELSTALLKHYDVEQLEIAGTLLDGCDQIFNMS
ncbi:lysozyme inhibitor LprI family protein [Nodosilinea sp. E11]|uniref:lysozyme inhibitor LprI family protein n=1 Tax=Nodosilinea sp. E11 TaxID=3037479 RepID=UPI0029346663|nr:lysozyme inhibitor LprI family protein [Nodosilinea sp. E11]WOD37128.1 lysozyme inhibitor LprI family protein [Nodosilinea sp. E11]